VLFDRLDDEVRPAATASLTLGVIVGAFGAVFGVGAVAAGASVAQACVMSLLVFTGASQFSAVSVIAAGGSIASALSSATLLAARNGVYGLTMARFIDGSLAKRVLAAQLVLDESTAMSTAQTTSRSRVTAFWVTGL
jgi:predicted branched-subunit amino acid permease